MENEEEDIFDIEYNSIFELSIVDQPANQGALIKLTKSKDAQGEKETMEKELAEVKERLEKSTKAFEDLQEMIISQGLVVTKKGITLDGELVKKAEPVVEEIVLGEVTLKSNETSPEAFAKLKAKAEADAKETLVEKAATQYPNIKPELALKFAEMDDEFAEFLAAIDKAMAAQEEELGHSNSDDITAAEKLKAYKDEYVESNKNSGKTPESLRVEAIRTEKGKELYKAAQAERKG